MKTRSVLVHFPGSPFTLQNLTPNRRLATLAGALIEAGHETVIRDLGAVGTLEQLFNEKLRKAAEPIADRLFVNSPAGPTTGFPGLRQWKALDRVLHARQEELCATVASEFGRMKGIDFVAFDMETASDAGVTVSIATRLAENAPSLRLLAVGPFAERHGELLARTTDVFDCVCAGEAESSVVEWAENLGRPAVWEQIPNLACVWRDNVRVSSRPRDSATSLPSPCYSPDVYPALLNSEKLKLFDVEDSRGCSGMCYGCEQPSRGGNGVRVKPAAVVYGEMANLTELYGARAFCFSNPGSSLLQMEALACEILSRGRRIWYCRTGQIRHMDTRVLPTLRASGCRAMSFRVDTGSQRLLDDYYGRDFGVTQAEHLLGGCKLSDIHTAACFTYPCPADDYHTRAETLRLVERTRPHAASVSLPEFAPASAWGRHPTEFGFALDERRYLRGVIRGSRSCTSSLRHWRAFPYSMNTRSWAQAIRENRGLCREIAALGVATSVSAKQALMAQIAGYEGCEEEFATLLRHQLFVGDVVSVADTVKSFNREACAPVNTMTLKPFTPVLAAVGN